MTGLLGEHHSGIDIGWCRDPGKAEAIADFFVAHADPSYISHSELQFGRAAAPGHWSEDLHAMLVGEARRAIAHMDGDGPGTRLALAGQGDTIAGLAFVSFVTRSRAPFAVLDDLLASPDMRGRGLGRTLLDWICDECRNRGFDRLFLESGIDNHHAHRFFERQGFAQTSVVMMRAL